MGIARILAVAMILATVSLRAEARLYYAITAEPEAGATIDDPWLCSSSIGAGGNLLEAGQRYAGKCQGGGLAPDIVGDKPFLHHLRFANDPGYRWTGKTRTELAVTQRNFPFDERVYLGFRMMIPRGTDVSVGSAFYLLQLWQCAGAPPIAGIRLTEGTSHTVNFMTRGDFRGASFADLDLLPGVWHRVILSFVVRPRGGGEVKLWVDQHPDPIVDTNSFGFFNVGTCVEGRRPPQHFRVKFGIYKDTEPGQHFDVRYDDFRIGNSYRSVMPW